VLRFKNPLQHVMYMVALAEHKGRNIETTPVVAHGGLNPVSADAQKSRYGKRYDRQSLQSPQALQLRRVTDAIMREGDREGVYHDVRTAEEELVRAVNVMFSVGWFDNVFVARPAPGKQANRKTGKRAGGGRKTLSNPRALLAAAAAVVSSIGAAMLNINLI
jgi:hypothetical protein